MEGQAVDFFDIAFPFGFEIVPLRGDAAHLQPQYFLRFQDSAGAEGVAAVERQRMIEDVKNAGHAMRNNPIVLNGPSTALE